MTRHVMDALIDKGSAKKTFVSVGLDADIEKFPRQILRAAGCVDGVENDGAAALAIRKFMMPMIETLSTYVPLFKPNLAFYWQYGDVGLVVLREMIDYIHSLGCQVILDAKLGDIGNTSAAYARAVAKMGSDWVTLNSYLGDDGVKPFIDSAAEKGTGVIPLIRTSNPGASDVQDELLGSGLRVYERVANKVSEWGKPHIGEWGYSLVGGVVGANAPEDIVERLRKRCPHTPFLLPAIGKQGATGADGAKGFDESGLGGFPAASRGITYSLKPTMPTEEGAAGAFTERGILVVEMSLDDFVNAAEQATIKLIADVNEGLVAAGKTPAYLQ